MPRGALYCAADPGRHRLPTPSRHGGRARSARSPEAAPAAGAPLASRTRGTRRTRRGPARRQAGSSTARRWPQKPSYESCLLSIRHLEHLLQPASVAVFGPCDQHGSVAATVWRSLRAGGFRGPLHAVNRPLAQREGPPAYPDLAALPEAPALAVICTPPEDVAPLVATLGQRGTRAALVMSGGLSAEQKQATLDAARPHLLRVLGPNSGLLVSPHLGLHASLAPTAARAGEVAFVSQSGALVTAVLDWGHARGVGFSRLVSLGEGCDVDVGDLLDWLAADGRTRSILLYLESVADARKFMSAARAAARFKPVVVVKAGRAGAGARAAASHTGALAGEDLVFDAAFRRAGMLRVDTLAELFAGAETLAHFGRHLGETLTVMTNGGGAGVLAADAAAAAGVPLAPLPAAALAPIDALLPAHTRRENPLDIGGDAPFDRYRVTLEALLRADPGAALLFMHAPTALVRSEDIARACLPLLKTERQRVMTCWLGDAAVADARALTVASGVADYETPEEAVRAFAMLGTYRRNQRQLLEVPSATPPVQPDRVAASALIAAQLAAGGGWLDADACTAMLRAYRIPTAPTRAAAADPEAAVAAAESLGWPVALKIRSPDLPHKSDVGGVVLGLADAPALRAAAQAMLARVHTLKPEARLDGFTVQPMVRRPRAEELIVGAHVDPVFGPVVLFGAGGTAAEVVADRAVALPPLNGPLARELISRTQIARRLSGYRDRPPANLDAVCGVLTAVAQMMADWPDLAELDINPLWADADGVLAVDARIRVAAGAGSGAARFAIQPYPDHLEQRLDWRGVPLVVRPIRPDDGERHMAFVRAVSPEDMRMRFFQVRRELPIAEIARMTQIDYTREMAFIAVRDQDGDGEPDTLGVARAVADPDNVAAEFAVVVRSDLKGTGLGRVLMTRLVDHFRSTGTQRLFGHVLRENDGMAAFMRSLGFHVDHQASDSDALCYVLPLQETEAEPRAA